MDFLFVLLVAFVFVIVGIRMWNKDIKPMVEESKANKDEAQRRIDTANLPQAIQNKLQTIQTITGAITENDLDRLGISLVLMDGKSDTAAKLFFCKHENKIYTIHSDGRVWNGIPSFGVNDAINDRLVYHPSDIRYTGASSGGISMGGFKDYGNFYTKEYENTGKGYVTCNIGAFRMIVMQMRTNSTLKKHIESNDFFKSLAPHNSGNVVFLHDPGDQYKEEIYFAAKTNNITAYQSFQNKRLALSYLEKGECKYLMDWFVSFAFANDGM